MRLANTFCCTMAHAEKFLIYVWLEDAPEGDHFVGDGRVDVIVLGKPGRDPKGPRMTSPLRMGDRLYVSYWHHGLFILDISNMSQPKVVSHTNTSPAPGRRCWECRLHAAASEPPCSTGGCT
jgi:LVIVD repeat